MSVAHAHVPCPCAMRMCSGPTCLGSFAFGPQLLLVPALGTNMQFLTDYYEHALQVLASRYPCALPVRNALLGIVVWRVMR